MTQDQLNQENNLRAHFLGRFLGASEWFTENREYATAERLSTAIAEIAEDYKLAYEYLITHGEQTTCEHALEYAGQARKDATNGK